MLICCLISLFFFLAFIISFMIVKHCPVSLSATYYETEKKWAFPVTLGICASLITAPMFDVTPDNFRCLVFLTIAGALFVSASPAFHDGLDKPIHYTSAAVMTGAIIAWIILMGYVPYLIILGGLSGLIFREYIVYLFELGLLANLYFVLIVMLV